MFDFMFVFKRFDNRPFRPIIKYDVDPSDLFVVAQHLCDELFYYPSHHPCDIYIFEHGVFSYYCEYRYTLVKEASHD